MLSFLYYQQAAAGLYEHDKRIARFRDTAQRYELISFSYFAAFDNYAFRRAYYMMMMRYIYYYA